MAPAVPASLKPVQPYITKADEMKTADPVVSYYCKYWAVQYAITLGLKDAEVNVFLANLLDSLEKQKVNMSNVEAITDDIVGKAYMENFAGNIFQKADDEERAKKATRATATKFLAAAQFMEVLRCFGDLDKETSDKIRYAKYQCARILKAIKAGDDPNGGAPVAEDEEPAPVQPYVSPGKVVTPPTIEAPLMLPMDRRPSDQSQHSTSSIPPIIPDKPSPPVVQPPFFPSQVPPAAPPSSFTPIDSPLRPAPPSHIPSSPPTNPYQSPPPPPINPYASPSQQPSRFSPPPPPPRPDLSPQHHQPPPPPSNYYTSSPAPIAPAISPAPTNYYTQPPQPSPSYFPPQPQQTIDDEDIAKAQKHARWAISALNYEDIETAVKELKNALSILGVKQ